MRILHFLMGVRLKDGGVARAVLDNAAVLAERGHDVVLATKDDSDIPADWPRAKGFVLAAGVPSVVVLREPSPHNRLARARTLLGKGDMGRMRALIQEADVLHLHGPWEPDNTHLARAAKALGTPYVVTPHGMLDDWSMAQRRLKKRIALAAYASRTLAEAAVVQCTASGEVEQAKKWIGHDRIEIIPCMIDFRPYATLTSKDDARHLIKEPDDGVPFVLFLSRLHYKKQPEVLLRAIAALHQQGRICRVNFAGTGDDAYVSQLKQLARDLHIEDHVRWMGLVTGDRKIAAYRAALVFALPTSQENFGLVFPESLACGTPVIATKGVDIWPELEASGGAVIADATPQAFSEAIGSFLDDPARADHMGKRGRAWALHALESGRTADRFVALYQRAAGTRPRPALKAH